MWTNSTGACRHLPFKFFKMCRLDISDKESRQNVQVFNMLCILVQYMLSMVSMEGVQVNHGSFLGGGSDGYFLEITILIR